MLIDSLPIRLLVSRKLLVVKIWGIGSYLQIIDSMGGGFGVPHAVQGSTVLYF